AAFALVRADDPEGIVGVGRLDVAIQRRPFTELCSIERGRAAGQRQRQGSKAKEERARRQRQHDWIIGTGFVGPRRQKKICGGRQDLECGGKRSATPLWLIRDAARPLAPTRARAKAGSRFACPRTPKAGAR